MSNNEKKSIIDRLVEEKLSKQAQETGPELDKAAADAMALDILQDALDEADRMVDIQIKDIIAKL
jgi:hypothetical protein